MPQGKGDGPNEEKRPRASRPSYLRGPGRRGGQPSPASGETPPQESKPLEATDKAPKERSVEEPKEDVELSSWRVWLFPRRPLVSFLVVVTLFGSIFMAYWALPSPLFITVITVILINRLAPYIFPVKYFMREETVGYSTLLAKDVREWSKFFTYYQFPDGVLLSLDTRTIRGRMREGLFLYYNADRSNKDEVLSIVSRKLKPPKEAAVAKDEGQATPKGGLGSAWRRIRNLRDKR